MMSIALLRIMRLSLLMQDLLFNIQVKKNQELFLDLEPYRHPRNLQEGNLIDGGFKIKSSSEIKSQFGGLEGVEKYKGYISYCNTGHWAATVWFGLSEIAQIPNVKMYDGGMTHWTYDPDII